MYACPVCLKSFDKKAGLTQHGKRKTPCKAPGGVTVVTASAVTTTANAVTTITNTFQNTAISLFSGCGGDTLGLERAGFHVIAFSELKRPMIETHLANFPGSTLIQDVKGKATDILKIEDSQFDAYKGKADILFAGFPCQGFSKAGKKKADDPRNQMYLQFVRAAKAIRPLFIIGENVQGLEHMKSGPLETDPPMLDVIRAAFEGIGYSLTHKVREATAFGVPQKRKRILLVGWDTERVKTFRSTAFWQAVDGNANTPVTLRSFVTNTMEGAYPLTTVPEDFAVHALPVAQDATPVGTPHPYVKLKADAGLLSCTKRESPIHSEIIDLDSPSKTVICTYGHQPRLLVGLRKPDGTAFARALLPQELKQIQGFPADYVLKGKPSEQVVQVGNAVPPPMIEAVAKAIRLAL